MTNHIVVPIEVVPDPIAVLHHFRREPFPALLHSANTNHPTGRYSFFSADPVDVVHANAAEWPLLRSCIRRTITDTAVPPALPPFAGGWIGWFSYELGRAFSAMPCRAGDEPGLPDAAWALYDWVVAWDHLQQRAWIISTGVDSAGEWNSERAMRRAAAVAGDLAHVSAMPRREHRAGSSVEIECDFSADEYRAAVATTVEHVLAGDIFQANLSQRFRMPYDGDGVDLFAEVATRTHAPMMAYLKHGLVEVVSGSPERFVRFDTSTRRAESRPIKGTRPRSETTGLDAALAAELVASEKDRAENVMIVDLVRNDLARVCESDSVAVPALCALESHPTVHHLVSTVEGTVRTGCDALDLVEAMFPGGSVTGAPKLRAMQVIAELEPVRRGVYCGAIGWIGLDGSMDTSIAIRTITLTESIASLHAGGGITARSEAAAEYDETIDKARALLASLGASA